MIVALGIFSILVIIAFGVAFSLSQAQIKAAKIQAVQGDLRFSLENITKEMRTGRNFIPANAISGLSGAFREITFTRRDGKIVRYALGADAIQKTVTDSSGTPLTAGAVTGEDVTVDGLVFYVTGTGTGDGQPRVTVSIRARSREPQLVSSLELQTSVTARGHDLQR